jgi:hypothetical protein
MGREFACRVYDEDELTPESIAESVFDIPVEKKKIMNVRRSQGLDSDVGRSDNHVMMTMEEEFGGPSFSQTVIQGLLDVDTTKVSKSSHGQQDMEQQTEDFVVPVQQDDHVKEETTEFVYTTYMEEYLESSQPETIMVSSTHPDIRIDEKAFIQSLNSLDGMCAQLHMGWWSYEWCYNDKVTQFHVQVQANQIKDVLSVKDLMPEFVVQSISTIGTFTKQKIIVETNQEQSSKGRDKVDSYDDNENEDETEQDISIIAHEEEQKEKEDGDGDDTKQNLHQDSITDILVIESYENGDYCEEAGANRVAEVHLRCCSNEDIISSFRQAGMTLRNPEMFAKPFDSIDAPRAVLLSVDETSVCNYTMTVCTNVVCDSWLENTMKNMAQEDAGSTHVAEFGNHASIRYILEQTLANSCLKRNEGWWTYSFCFKSSIYQYHESVDLDLELGVMTAKIEASHVLGKYDAESSEGFPNEDEVHHIIFPKGRIQGEVKNDIDVDSTTTSSSTTQSLVTDSAFYEQEYKHGDVCEGDDVIESAIKGGEVSEGGIIERSTTVRFFCGNSKELVRINEDQTCHYIVDITLPELCSHKYFAIPQIKKHVMKCVLL